MAVAAGVDGDNPTAIRHTISVPESLLVAFSKITMQKVGTDVFPDPANRLKGACEFFQVRLVQDVGWIILQHPFLGTQEADWPIMRHQPFCSSAFKVWVDTVVKPVFRDQSDASAVAEAAVAKLQNDVRLLYS